MADYNIFSITKLKWKDIPKIQEKNPVIEYTQV